MSMAVFALFEPTIPGLRRAFAVANLPRAALDPPAP